LQSFANCKLKLMPTLPLLLLAVCFSLASCEATSPPLPSLLITTRNGMVQGAWQHNPYANTSGCAQQVACVAVPHLTPLAESVAVWKSIPFAAPPVASLRFAPPQPPQPWTGVYDATRYRDACVQLRCMHVARLCGGL
jgi:hypothetical protein